MDSCQAEVLFQGQVQDLVVDSARVAQARGLRAQAAEPFPAERLEVRAIHPVRAVQPEARAVQPGVPAVQLEAPGSRTIPVIRAVRSIAGLLAMEASITMALPGSVYNPSPDGQANR